ncbi:MAG: aminomethyl-transferring glycine dehydrogenase subunit GcvPA, partial [Candidatus Goldbacteria bacterium]|nr:aminomethyl-transferring glycine dehydrogenase subunit GcvPA [Candidatus Goldiibacteriota bacterium]
MAKFTPHTESEIKEMLSIIGVQSIDDLFLDIPKELKPKSFNIPYGKTEYEVDKIFQNLAKSNRELVLFAGGGYYDHYIPAAVDAISSRTEFYTAYTPYQPEASQGTLQAIFEYQTMISRLMGLPFANASLYDGGTALYEAIAMAVRTNNRQKVIIDGGINPIFIKIIRTYIINLDLNIEIIDLKDFHSDKEKIKSALTEDVSCVVIQNPNFFGFIDDYSDIFNHAKTKNICCISVVNPISLSLLKTPGEMGADIAVAEGQPLGMPLSFGGPYLGILATTKDYLRKMPGRIVGKTIDKNGKDCFVLTLQAREQHIKREKATSNICSNQALCALRAVVYLSLLGKEGFKNLGFINLQKTEELKSKLKDLKGLEIIPGFTFNEFSIRIKSGVAKVINKMLEKNILAGIPASLFYKNMDD